MGQGWFESDDDYQERTAQEANEAVIKESTGSAPSKGFFEDDDDYRERIGREASERIVQDSTGSAPSQGFWESDDNYRERISREAHERIVRDSTGTAPAQRFFESDGAYHARVRDAANERTIRDATGSAPSHRWFESTTAYRQRIAVTADEHRARNPGRAPGRDRSSASNEDTTASSDTPASTGAWFVIVLVAVIAYVVFGAPTSRSVARPRDTIVVTSNAVNVREQPSTRARILMRVNRGDHLLRVRVHGDWTEITRARSAARGTAWIHSSFVTSPEQWAAETSRRRPAPSPRVAKDSTGTVERPGGGATHPVLLPEGDSVAGTFPPLEAVTTVQPGTSDGPESPAPPEHRPIDLEGEARTLFANGDYAAALAATERQLLLGPNHALSLLAGYGHLELRRPHDAVPFLTTAVDHGETAQIPIRHHHRFLRVSQLSNGTLRISAAGLEFRSPGLYERDSFSVPWTAVAGSELHRFGGRRSDVVALKLKVRLNPRQSRTRTFNFFPKIARIVDGDVECSGCQNFSAAFDSLIERYRAVRPTGGSATK